MPLFPRDVSTVPAALHFPDESVIHKYQQLTIFLKMKAVISLINLTFAYFNMKTLTSGICDNWWKSQKPVIVSWLAYGISITHSHC